MSDEALNAKFALIEALLREIKAEVEIIKQNTPQGTLDALKKIERKVKSINLLKK